MSLCLVAITVRYYPMFGYTHVSVLQRKVCPLGSLSGPKWPLHQIFWSSYKGVSHFVNAKLVSNYNFTMVYGWYIYTYIVFKPTYNWGGTTLYKSTENFVGSHVHRKTQMVFPLWIWQLQVSDPSHPNSGQDGDWLPTSTIGSLFFGSWTVGVRHLFGGGVTQETIETASVNL